MAVFNPCFLLATALLLGFDTNRLCLAAGKPVLSHARMARLANKNRAGRIGDLFKRGETIIDPTMDPQFKLVQLFDENAMLKEENAMLKKNAMLKEGCIRGDRGDFLCFRRLQLLELFVEALGGWRVVSLILSICTLVDVGTSRRVLSEVQRCYIWINSWYCISRSRSINRLVQLPNLKIKLYTRVLHACTCVKTLG
jgi:hypothetical protein